MGKIFLQAALPRREGRAVVGGKLSRAEASATGEPRQVSRAAEIDVMAADRGAKNLLLGECKFRNSEAALGDFERLAEKYAPPGAKISYSLFSKSGFSRGLMDEAGKIKASRSTRSPMS